MGLLQSANHWCVPITIGKNWCQNQFESRINKNGVFCLAMATRKHPVDFSSKKPADHVELADRV